jgi:hypothetical protein
MDEVEDLDYGADLAAAGPDGRERWDKGEDENTPHDEVPT